VLLSSCASYQLPEGYSGSTASIRSTGKRVNSVKGEGYYILEVNGKFAQHSPMATPRGAGMGISLSERPLQVPCEPLELKLSGGSIYAADGVALADSMSQIAANLAPAMCPPPRSSACLTAIRPAPTRTKLSI